MAVATSARLAGQTPVQVPISFQHGRLTLHGVLVLPDGRTGPVPAVIFVHGAGGVDRTGFGLYPAIWRHLASRGIASLSWDKPGVKGSDGDWRGQTIDDRAEEVIAAWQLLRSRPELDRARIGLWGISQGGWVAPVVAARVDELAFIISVSGAGVSPEEQDLFRIEHTLRAARFPASDIEAAKAFGARRARLALQRADYAAFEREQAPVASAGWLSVVGKVGPQEWQFLKNLIGFNPEPAWARVRCRVLLVYGARDTLVPVRRSREIIERVLTRAGTGPRLQTRVFEGADHAITLSQTGSFDEMARNVKQATIPFAPGYLALLSSWILSSR